MQQPNEPIETDEPDAPASDADEIGYDDPTQSPVEALRGPDATDPNDRDER